MSTTLISAELFPERNTFSDICATLVSISLMVSARLSDPRDDLLDKLELLKSPFSISFDGLLEVKAESYSREAFLEDELKESCELCDVILVMLF